MSNSVLLTIAQEDGNTVSKTQLFNPADMTDIVADGSAITFKANGKEFKTGALTLTQLKNQINTGAPSGAFDVTLVFDPSANTGERTIAAHDLLDENGNVFYLPDNTRVWDGYYEVVTTFTSATDGATISLGIPTDDSAGLFAATAISTGTTWDAAAPKALIQVGTIAAISEKTTAARTVQATVASEALTAGKLYVHLKCITVPS